MTAPLSVRVSEKLISELEEIAAETERSKAFHIQKAIENLGNVSQELGKVLYEEAAKKQAASASAGQASQAPPPPPEGDVKRKGGDDVIDAEFEANDS